MNRLKRSSLRILFSSAIALMGIFAKTSAVTAPGPNDPDADGLTNAQEASLGTNPNLFDTDGDGMSDGDEVRAGTDPRSASSVFRILGAPKRTGTGWEISWSSVPGKSYKLQRLVGDVIPLANIQWIDIQPVTASALASIAVDASPAGGTRFYRVVLVDQVGDSQSPSLGFLKADPSPIRAEGIVTLTVEASDNIDVAAVTFFDGSTPLGSASRGEGDLWRFFWPLEFAQNGLHTVSARASDAAGNTTTSSNLTFTAAITNSQPKQVVGQIPIKGDSFVTNGTTVTVGGNVRLGNATLSSGSTLKINSSLITGNGTVSLPGMGPVYRGPFEVDTATGWLHASTAAQPMLFALPVSLPPIQLSSNVTIQATNLTANILNNALSGGGTILLKLDGDGGTVQFDGSFALNYQAFVLTLDGKCTYKGIVAGGQAVLNVGKKTFQLEHGAISLSGGTGSLFTITDGAFGLTIQDSNQAEFTIGGKLTLPIPVTITVAGKLSTLGSFALTGTGTGTVAGFIFDPLELSLNRSTTDAPVSLTFKGGIKHAVGTIKVTGTLNSDGTVTNLSSGVEDLNLGNGVRLLVENGQPVLNYLQEIAGVRKFQVNGGFRVPSPSPVLTSVHVSGTLELEGNVSDLHVKSFTASSEAGLNLTLPGNIIAKEAHVSLGYGNGAFNARLGGKIDLSDNAKIPFDAGLILQENDTQDIQIDAIVSPSGLNLNTAYLFSSVIRLEAKTPTSTRNASGKITIQGNVGFFRRGLLPPNPTAADFYISGTNVTASFGFQGENYTALLSSGTLNLPPGFSTRICSGAGGGPAVSITPATPIVLTYSGSLKSLSITGGFDFSNLGFTIPGGSGAALELCTARLVFASDTQYLTNITGRLLIPQASGDFQLTSGSMDASGKFDFTSSGKFVLAQTSVTYSALRAQYDGTNFFLSGSGSAVLPNGAIAEVSARLTNGSLSFVGTQNRLDFGGGVVLVPIEPAAQNPMLQFAASSGAFEGTIKGRLQLPNNQFVEMTGTINNNVLTLRSTARVHLGDGVWLSPVAPRPVLDLVANTAGALSFNVQGLFQWPGKGGVTEQTVVSGDLHLTANAQGILVSSFHADSTAPNLVLSLAPNLTLRQAEINLGYENLAFRAHIAGTMDIATTTLNVDAQLILNTANENDVRIAADLAVQNLNIVDQLYWFPSALRLEAQTRVGDRPEFTRLRATGKAGLFAKNSPISSAPADGDFNLLARNAAAVLDLTTDAFGIRIEQGTIVLPAIFQSGLCASGGAGPTAAISAANPVIATYQLSTHALAFSGAIQFQNLGVTLPDFPQVSGELCNALLFFASNELPYLTNVAGRLTIPFPKDQTTSINIQNGAWKLDGLPSGTISLGNDVTLYDKNNFRFRLLSQSPTCTGGSSLTIFPRVGTQLPKLVLNGGIEAALPLDLVSGVAGDRAVSSVCGGITLTPPTSASVQVTDFSFAGSFHLGQLDGVTVSNASLTLSGVDSLFNTQSTQALTLTISGDLDTGHDVKFSLRSAAFTIQRLADGSFKPVQLTGSGQLGLPQNLTVDASLNFNIAAETLAFNSSASNLQLRLTDDLVLFDAGFGFSVSAASQSAALRVAGSAGMFAKGTLGATARRQDFHLIADGVNTTFKFNPNGFDLRFENGTLRLPEIFTAGLCPGGGTAAPSISLDPVKPVVVSFLKNGANNQPEISFSGALDFANIGFKVPDYPDLAAEICTTRLIFSNRELPYFTNITGALTVPLPPGKKTEVDIAQASWKVNGFPRGTVLLPQNVPAFDQGGFTFTILGGKSCGDSLPPTSFTIGETKIVNGVVQLPRLEIHGGVELKVAKSMLQNDTTDVPSATNPDPQQVHGSACGSLILSPDSFPRLSWESATIGGSFRIGSGIRIKNASLTLEGLDNIFHQTSANPFIIRLGGTIDVTQGPAFGLENTRFVFFDNNQLPQLQPGKFIYQQDDWELPNKLPLVVREASIQFLDGTKSKLEELFSPTNVKVGLSATIAIPNAQEPYFSGSINDLTVTFKSDGTPDVSIDGFGITLDPGIKIPPIDEIGGSVFVSGLQRAIQDPTALFFTGRVAGSYQGYKLKFLLAFNLLGPIGMCVDVNAGSVGIPLAQSGFIISGASGGFSFVNSNADPCAFSTYMDADGKPISNPLQLPAGVPPFPIAPMSWAQLRDYVQRFAEGQLQAVPRVRSDGTGELTMQAAAQTIPCPGDCPPATVNIFCQPHPDSQMYPGRIITKFTSIDEGTLNTVFGITEERIQNLLNASQNIAVDLAHILRVKLDETIPDPDPALGSGNVTRLRQLQTQTFDTIESSYRDILAVSIGNSRVASVIYDKIRAIVYAGLPCADVNFTVSGTMSHLAVSSFLSITGQGTLSTTGTAGVAGKVNLLGVPVGIGKVFVAATDAKGLPNPSICGDLHVAIGPLELGYLKAALKCDECVSGVLQIFANLVVKLSRPVIDDIIRHVAPQLQLPALQADVGTFLNTQLSPEQKIAFMAELFQIAPNRLPIDLDQVLLTARDAVGLIIDRINPEMLMCGQVKPKLFGIPMGADYGTVQYRLNKFGRDATFSFSPSMMLLDPRMAALIPPADNATFGYAEVFPDFGKAIVAGLSGKLSSPQAAFEFAKDQFASMLENSTYTAAYELSPMGFKLARAAARAVNPDLTNHPLIRQPAWVHPDLRGQGLLSQEQILQASLRAQLLGNSLWKGNITDLAQIFPEGSPERALYQSKSLSLTKDYFPYGGIIGAGYLDVPRAFYETVPQEFFTMIGATNQLLQRLVAGFTYVNDYVLKNTEAGTLSFYIPAPNPPAFQKNGVVLSPLELMESLMAQDVQSIRTTPLYPLSEMFMQGEFHGKLLGVDVADAHMVAVLGDGNSTDAYFRVDASLGQNAWVRQLVDQATFAFEIRQRPEAAIEKAFAPYVARLQQLIAQNASDAGAAQTLLADIENACINNMPKVSLEAALQNLHIPPALASYLAVDGSASATVYAYSPRFQPGAVGDGPISEAKRRGGAALKANLKFGNYFSIPNAELAVFPRDAGLPEMRAHIGPVSANLPGGVAISGGTLDFNSLVPSIAVSGRISPINLGVFQIAPLSGADIGASVRVSNNSSGQPSTSISILPAQLKLGLLGNDSMQLRIQGATANDPFTYSSDSPWNASVSLEGTSPFELKNGGDVVLRIQRSSINSMVLSRDSAGVIRLTVSIPSGVTLSAFPDTNFAQTFTTSTANTLTVGSDGSFAFDTSVNDQVFAGVTLKGKVTLTNIPELSFSLGGAIIAPSLGAFNIVPAVSGSPLAGNFVVKRVGTTLDAKIVIQPAKLTSSNVLGSSQSLLIDGGSDQQPFTFSNVGPWSARVSTAGTAPLELKSGADTVLRIQRSSMNSMQLSRDAAGVVRLTVSIPSGATLAAFPDTSFAQSLTTSSATTLTVASDGTFNLDVAVNDQTFAGVTLKGRATLSNSPDLAFSLGGQVVPPSLGGFNIVPNISGSPLAGSFVVKRVGASLDARVVIQPSKLTIPNLTGADQSFRIDGGTDLQEFSFSNVGPWSARLTLNQSSPLELRAGVAVLARVANASVRSATITRNAAGITSIAINLPTGASIQAFPGTTFAQTFTISSDATISIASDGTFALNTTSSSAFAFPNGPVGSVQSGAAISLTQNSLTITGNLGGGVLGTVNTGTTANGTVTASANGSISASGSVSVTPLVLGQFRVEPSAGGNFTASLGANGLTIPSGARILFNGAVLADVTLPTFVISPNGDFGVSAGPANVSLNGFGIGNASFTLGRVGAATSIQNLAGLLKIPAIGGGTFATVSVSNGAINSNGTFSLSGAIGSSLSLANLPITGMAANSTVAFNETALTISGSISGGVLNTVPLAATATGKLTFASTGAISLSGSVSVAAWDLNQFRLESTSTKGTTFSASLGVNGLTIPSGARLLYKSAVLADVNLPAFTIAASGNFSVNVGPANVTLNGFSIGSASFTFRRQANVTSIQNFQGNVTIPNGKGGVLASVSLTGSLSDNGNFTLGGSAAGPFSPLSVPITTLQNATVDFDQNSLIMSGSLGGGILSQVSALGATTGSLAITSAGQVNLTGTITVAPFVNLPFHLESSSGGNMLAGFTKTGLSFNGIRLRVDNIFSTPVTLPDFVLPTSGILALNVNPPALSILGIPVANVNFTLRRSSGGPLSIDPITANLNIPGFSQQLSGSISSVGAATMDYNGSLTMAGFVASNGGLHLRNSGLSADGSFDLRHGAVSFGQVGFQGGITYNSSNNSVSYNLGRTGGGITIGGFSIPSPNLSLSSSGFAQGNATLPFGNLSVPLNHLSISANNGLAFDNYPKSIDSGWVRFFDAPFGDIGDVSARLAGQILFSKSGDAFTSNLSYTWAGWIVTEHCNPLPPFGDGKCNTQYPPGNIDDGSGKLSGSASIGSTGKFTVNTGFGGQSSFTFGPFW